MHIVHQVTLLKVAEPGFAADRHIRPPDSHKCVGPAVSFGSKSSSKKLHISYVQNTLHKWQIKGLSGRCQSDDTQFLPNQPMPPFGNSLPSLTMHAARHPAILLD